MAKSILLMLREGYQKILAHFESIIKRQLHIIQEQKGTLRGVGIAFPGPFDYANGISLVKGLRKYDVFHR